MSEGPEKPQADPSMRPTRTSVLIVAGLAAAAVGWVLVSFSYYNTAFPFDKLPWSPAVVLFVLALAEGVLAQNTSARINRKPGTLPVDPLAVARYVALAKASSLVGALSAGFSAGLLSWLVLESTEAARKDVSTAAAGLVAAATLIGAALWLERSCRIPDDSDRTGDRDREPPTGRPN